MFVVEMVDEIVQMVIDEAVDCCASNRTCSTGLWKCDNGRCISPDQRCNGIHHCR